MYTATKKISKGINLLATFSWAKLQKKHIPLVLYFLVTERCNCRCPYCWIRRDTETLSHEMSTETILKVIDEFYAIGTRYMSILGGEPLLRKDLDVIVEHLNKLNMMNDIVTNGTLIEPQLETLKKFDLVCVSLEGNQETHDHDRGQGTHAQVMKGIELLAKHKIRFRFNTTVTQHTVHSFPYVLELAKKYNAAISVGIAVVSSGQEKEIIPTVEMIIDFWKQVRTFKTQGYPIEKSVRAIDGLIKNAQFFLESSIYEKDIPPVHDYNPCLFGKYLGYLGADGTIFPCPHPDLFGKKEFHSNIFTYGTKTAWKNLVQNTPCSFCNLLLGCEINNFLNLNARSVLESARAYFFDW